MVSLQDTNNYKSNQQSMSGGVAVSESGASGSASYSQSTVTSNFASVNQQTGLYAGSGGFQIDVGNNTNLTGAVIASTAPANDNSLTTNTLSFSDILNKANYSASTIGGSFSSSGGLAGNALANGASLLGSLTGPGGNASGTTFSAISAGTINVLSGGSTAGLSRDTTGANGSIAPIFNLQQIQNNQAVGQAFGQIANNIAGDVIAASGWSEDSTQGILLHGLVGAMQGQISGGNALAGAAGGAASAALAPAMAQYLVSQGLDPNSDEFKQLMQAGSQIVGTAIGAAVGAASGTGAQSGALTGGQASLSSTANNYLKHDQLQDLITALSTCTDDACKQAAEAKAEAQSNANSAALVNCPATAGCYTDALNDMKSDVDLINQNSALLTGTNFISSSTNSSTSLYSLVLGTPASGAESDHQYADAALGAVLGQQNLLGSTVPDSFVGKAYTAFQSTLADPNATPAQKTAALNNYLGAANLADALVVGSTLEAAGTVGSAVVKAGGVGVSTTPGGATSTTTEVGPVTTTTNASSSLGLPDTLLPDADFAGQGTVRPDLASHLVDAGVSGKQISGGHNLDNFTTALRGRLENR